MHCRAGSPFHSGNQMWSVRKKGMSWSRPFTMRRMTSGNHTVSSSPYKIHLKLSMPSVLLALNGASAALHLSRIRLVMAAQASAAAPCQPSCLASAGVLHCCLLSTSA